MAGSALLTFVGNLADPPDLRVSPKGVEYARFTVANNRRDSDGAGGWKDGPTTFYRCTAFGALAAHLAESLRKGDRVLIVGSLTAREWTANDGTARLSLDVEVDEAGPSLRFATATPVKADKPPRALAAVAGDPPF
jgi:single-strand DNA-binding protein